jgi:hypothetical protein
MRRLMSAASSNPEHGVSVTDSFFRVMSGTRRHQSREHTGDVRVLVHRDARYACGGGGGGGGGFFATLRKLLRKCPGTAERGAGLDRICPSGRLLLKGDFVPEIGEAVDQSPGDALLR